MTARATAAHKDRLPRKPEDIRLARTVRPADRQRALCICLGIAIFCVVYLSPAWPDAADPAGNHFALTREGKATLGLFALALTWWVAEVVPIGVTAIAIGIIQALFSIRPAKAAFADFMDPSVWFIVASLVIGMTFTKTGLTKRVAYKILVLVGEKTSMIYLGGFAMVAALTLVMAHTAAAATVFPLLMAIHSLYEDSDKPTRFGKGLFIGMAFAAAAASTVSLLGSARAPVALGFFKDMAGRDLSFFEWTYYMLPLGWGMAFLLWLYCLILFRPEKTAIPGLRDRARALYERLGPMTRNETLALLLVLAAIAALALGSLVPAMAPLDRTATMLMTTLLFFLFRILTIQDLEEIPWNIALLFGGAMSIGTCIWQTGAARWVALHALALWPNAPWTVFVLGIGLLVLVLTNLVVNVAVIAVCLPVALVMARYLGVAPEVILFTSLAAAGMPFMLLIGAAPNAIAYGSRQFTPGEFLRAGAPASVLLMVVIGLFVWLIWPLMGMPVIAR